MTLRLIDRGLMIVSVVAAALFVVLLFAGPSLIGAKSSSPVGAYGAPASSSSSSSTSSAASSSAPGGAAVFASAGCAGCHTLKSAGATGSIGPNLDQVHPSASTVASIVRSGAGTMPSFSGKLSSAQIAAVASYVASSAGR
jgi:mono/diheme cytochrome c family protein